MTETLRSNLKQLGITLIAAFATSGDIFAQEDNRSGAVEEFSPAFDAVYAMRPRAGLYGITELMIAALEGDLTEIDRLLEQGTNINETDMSGGTPLMWAVQGGDIRAVDLLLERGANINAIGARNSSALTTAIFGDREDIGVRLLNAGAKFGGELRYQRDYLQYAAEKGQARIISALIEQGAEIESSGPDALCIAIRYEKFEAAKTLIDSGVDVNQPGTFRNDLPMVHALDSRNQTLIQTLIDNGAELNRKDKAGKMSLAYHAVRTGNPSIVRQLLDNGAVIDEEEVDQLLGAAIYTGSIEMIDLFVGNGAKIMPRNVFNALSRKHFEMASALLDSVGIPNLDDNTLDALTEQAEQYGHGELADALLDVIVARENEGHLRLLFETVGADRCRLESWDPATRAVHDIVLDDYSCDAGLFISRQKSSLFLLEGDSISVLSLNKAFSTFKLHVPAQEIETRLDEIREQFTRRIGGSQDWVTATIQAIGYLGNGQIGLMTHTGGPADGTYASLFAWNGVAWSLIDTQGCGRFNWICRMPDLDGRSIDDWPMRRAVWHTALRRNPGFVERVSRSNDNYESARLSAAIFDFGGRRSELGYSLAGSDHCSEECTFTEAVEIKPPGADPTKVALANSRVSIAGQYILVRPVKSNSHLYDLSTGENILGDLGRAAWVH